MKSQMQSLVLSMTTALVMQPQLHEHTEQLQSSRRDGSACRVEAGNSAKAMQERKQGTCSNQAHTCGCLQVREAPHQRVSTPFTMLPLQGG
jgi:hypothetical protein